MSERARFLLFVLVGGFAAIVNLVSRILINLVTSYEVAIVLAFPIALTTAFLFNRRHVFNAPHGPWGQQYRRFAIVNLLALAQVFLVSVGLARFLFPAMGFTWHADIVAHAIGLVSPIMTSFWVHKRYSFAGGAPAGAAPGTK